MMTSQLEPSEIVACLQVHDLTDPANGDHAMQTLLTNIVEQLSSRWAIPLPRTLRPRPLVSIEDNYDRLGYDPAAVTRDRATPATPATRRCRAATPRLASRQRCAPSPVKNTRRLTSSRDR